MAKVRIRRIIKLKRLTRCCGKQLDCVIVQKVGPELEANENAVHEDGGGAERETGLLAGDGEQFLELLHDILVVKGQEVSLPLPGEAGLVAGR